MLFCIGVLPNIELFPVAFGCWKCYYLPCFKESDSWSMIFDIGGSRTIAAIGPKGQNLLPPWHNARRRRRRGILTRTSATYAILRIWLDVKPPKFQKKPDMWDALRV